MAGKKQSKSTKTKGQVPSENPYARRRLVVGIATVVFLIAYFVMPPVGYEVPRLVVLIVFFVLITVCPLFQQQYRQWRDEHRPRH